MRYNYCIIPSKIDYLTLSEVIRLVLQQAYISTRQKSDRWKLIMYEDNIIIRFQYKADAREFSEALEENIDELLAHHDLVMLERRSAASPTRFEVRLMPTNSFPLF